jgi:drug/metabolite transporter (DMT)-like permease
MAAIPLSLLAALCWGSADFIGGIVSRRNAIPGVMLTVLGVGLAAALAFVLVTSEPLPSTRAIAFAVIGGTIGSAGLTLFYLAMSLGKLGVVTPIAASGVAVPVIVGIIGGDSLATMVAVGLALAVTGIIFSSIEGSEEELHEDKAGGRRVVAIALLAALGLGSYFVFAKVAYEESVAWTLVFGRVVAVPVLLAAVVARHVRMPSGRDRGLAVGGGLFDVSATALVGLALAGGALSIVAVLSSLYPVVTIFLAFLILRERLRPVQALGALLALSGVVLIAAG